MGFALGVAVVLPWFTLPLLGWSVPIPAWNALGLLLMVLAGLQILRALGLAPLAWAVRMLTPWALYKWWGAPEQFRLWGKATLAPMQMKLSGVNSTLSTLGAETVTVFDPTLWREVVPGWGYKLAGASLLLSLVVSWLDWPARTDCPFCKVTVSPEDPCCHGCGHRFPEVPACPQCGRAPQDGDRHCRACGTSLARERAG